MGFNQMIADEELNAIVDNYCRKIRKICDEAIYAKNDEVIEKVAKISKIAARINEIKSIQQAQKTTGEEYHGFCWICRRNRLHKRMVELTKAENELKEAK